MSAHSVQAIHGFKITFVPVRELQRERGIAETRQSLHGKHSAFVAEASAQFSECVCAPDEQGRPRRQVLWWSRGGRGTKQPRLDLTETIGLIRSKVEAPLVPK